MNDRHRDEELRRLLSPLREFEPGPTAPGVDVARAIREGERRLRVRRAATPVVAAFVVALVTVALVFLAQALAGGGDPAPPAEGPQTPRSATPDGTSTSPFPPPSMSGSPSWPGTSDPTTFRAGPNSSP